MFDVWLLLLFSQAFIVANAQAASLSLTNQNALITLPKTRKLTTADHADATLTDLSNEISLSFITSGDPIPAGELSHTLSVASARVQVYLPRHADEAVSDDYFETVIHFPGTGDIISISFYVYGIGLSWLELSRALVILRQYMLGMGPGHLVQHIQQLEFYVRLEARVEVAYGVVTLATRSRAVAKRGSVTTSLQLPHANFSSPTTVILPIIFNIPKTNLDLNITSLGQPIPEMTILTTIELAFTEIMLDHTDIDAPIPANMPFSFNATFGKQTELVTAEIRIDNYPGKQITWGLVCILIYGLRDFMSETMHFNALSFEIKDGRLGWIGHGDVLYGPDPGTASTQKLKLGRDVI